MLSLRTLTVTETVALLRRLREARLVRLMHERAEHNALTRSRIRKSKARELRERVAELQSDDDDE